MLSGSVNSSGDAWNKLASTTPQVNSVEKKNRFILKMKHKTIFYLKTNSIKIHQKILSVSTQPIFMLLKQKALE